MSRALSPQKPGYQPHRTDIRSPQRRARGSLIVGASPLLPVGEAFHRVLELVDIVVPRDIEELAAAVCAVAGLDDHTVEIAKLVRACLETPAAVRARSAERRWTQVPYTLRVGDAYLTGRIDLAFEEAGELVVVVDWKSDSVGPAAVESAAEAHRSQAGAYVRALENDDGDAGQRGRVRVPARDRSGALTTREPGYSACELAKSWEADQGFPRKVREALETAPEGVFRDLELLIGLPEHKVPLRGGKTASQTDLLYWQPHTPRRRGRGWGMVAAGGRPFDPPPRRAVSAWARPARTAC